MAIIAVSMEDMHAARERRAQRQRALLAEHGLSIVCFTMYIAGDARNSPCAELAFLEGLRRLKEGCSPVFEEIHSYATGCEGFLVADMEPEALKALAVDIEEQDALGRLFNMEVFDKEGLRQERDEAHPRACLVCGGPVEACARSRTHDQNVIRQTVDNILREYVSKHYAEIAVQSLLEEVRATPKPGLVDMENNGAHKDMDLALLCRSAEALEPYFVSAIRLGLDKAGEGADETHIMRALRKLGLKAEADMFETTGGVNTHKGIVYSLGLLCCGWGLCLSRGWGRPAETAAGLVQTDICGEFLRARAIPKTHGEALYAMGGFTGARGEAAEGFPHAQKAADWLLAYKEEENAPVLALLHVMAELMDTNVLYRGGREGLHYVQEGAKRICEMPVQARIVAAREFDEALIAQGLSPGGAADMLALGIFLNKMRVE